MSNNLKILIFIICGFAFQASVASNDLRVIYTYGGVGKELTGVLQEFGRKEGVTIIDEYMDQSVLKSNIMAIMESPRLPDVFIIPADHLGLNELLGLNYSEVDPHLFKASIPDRIWESGMSDGKLYGAPLVQGSHLMLYYNKNLVKEPARDWQAMFAQQRELKAKNIAVITWPYNEAFWFIPFLGAFGAWPLHDGKVALNTLGAVDALDFYKSLSVKQLINPDCDGPCSVALFKAEKVAYVIDGDWQGVEFYKVLGDKLGVSAIPDAQGKKMTPSFSTFVIAFPNDSLNGEKRALLIQLVNYLQSTKVQQHIWQLLRAVPVENIAFNDAQKNAQGYLKQTLELMSYTKPLPADQAMSFIWDAINKGGISHRKGALNSKDAAQYMQQLAERNQHSAKANPLLFKK